MNTQVITRPEMNAPPLIGPGDVVAYWPVRPASDRIVYELSCLVDAAARGCARDWLTAAVRLVDVVPNPPGVNWTPFRLSPKRTPAAPPIVDLLYATQAIAQWLRSEQRGDAQEWHARACVVDVAAAIASGLHATPWPMLLANAIVGRGTYPIAVHEAGLVNEVCRRAHAGRLALYGYPIQPDECEGDCGELGGVAIGTGYFCPVCAPAWIACDACHRPTLMAEIVWVEGTGRRPDAQVCDDCAHGRGEREFDGCGDE